jgi:hypothetical protein
MIITKGGKPVAMMSRPSLASNRFKFGFSDTPKDLSTRRVGKSFTGSRTLTVFGLIYAQTALSLRIAGR